MNTDNVAISGETIDYGPCAFMDRYDPATVYSSIDHAGRYAYGNQPAITQWNLARLAETLLPLINPDLDLATAAASDVLAAFPNRYHQFWLSGMRTKLGLTEPTPADEALIDNLLTLLHTHRVDYTTAFRALASTLRGDSDLLHSLFEASATIDGWTASWKSRLETEGRHAELVAKEMDCANPVYIPRNHTVEEALAAATGGDMAPFHALLEAVTNPFDERTDLERFAGPAPGSFDETFQTFCGT